MSIRIGCSGWSYDDWVGPFYPKNAEPSEYLRLYGKVFNCVEIDSSFYRAPSTAMVKQWYESTPKDFMFSPKLPKRITHDMRLENVASYLDYFTRTMSLLREKLGPIVIQLPPSFKFEKYSKQFSTFLESLTGDHRYAVEFRHPSWFISEVTKLLENKNVSQVWSINQYLTTPSTVTSDFIYLRFVGDRKIGEFGKLQRDQNEVITEWKKHLVDAGESVKQRFVLFNNHFAGFGPGSVNEFRRLLGIFELDWTNLGADLTQRTMFDFSK